MNARRDSLLIWRVGVGTCPALQVVDSYPSESWISSTEGGTLGVQAAGRTGQGLAAARLNTQMYG